jgi:hypothetical protein
MVLLHLALNAVKKIKIRENKKNNLEDAFFMVVWHLALNAVALLLQQLPAVCVCVRVSE